MGEVDALRDRDRPAESAAPRAAPAAGLELEFKDGRVPPEVVAAWVQFLRDEVADAANGLNNRLQVLDAARRALADDQHFAPELRPHLETIGRELERAEGLTRGLLRRVTAFAPETLPDALLDWDQSPVPAGHVLVVEDDDANRSVIRRLLERLGHRVTTAANGLEAFEVLRGTDGAIDCIVCDLQMPALGGRGFFQQVEATWPPLTRRFVFVTGDYTRPASRAFLEETGCPVIGKPYELTQLVNAVRLTLHRRQPS